MNYYPNWYAYQDPYYNGSLQHYGNNMNRYGQMPQRKEVTDSGPYPFVTNINEETITNKLFRKALWTGNHLQVTVMSLKTGEDIGLEMHPDIDQFIRVEAGQGIIRMGSSPDNLSAERAVFDDYAIIIPAGTWHNLINIGDGPLKLYSIYAPASHPPGTIHQTKQDAIESEQHHSRNYSPYSPW